MNKGEGFKTFFWTKKNSEDTLNIGWYGYSKVDSIEHSNGNTKYIISFGLPKYRWWLKIFSRGYLKSAITITDYRPESIDQYNGNFINAKWIKGFERLDSSGTINFIFPILPAGKEYNTYDYFSVIINDTSILQYQWINDGTVAIGTIINNRHKSDGRTRIYSKCAIAVKLTDKNPLRIKYIQIDTNRLDLITEYLGYDFKYLIKDASYFGLSIIDNGLFFLDRPKAISFY